MRAPKSLKQFFRIDDQENNKVIEGIKRIPLFHDFREREIRILAHKCYIRHFAAEEEIYSENSPSAAIYFVVFGSVGMYKKRRSKITDRVQVVHAGKFFGETALVNDSPRRHSVKAMEKTEVLVLFQSDFKVLEQQYPGLALKFLKFITTKFYNELNIFQTEFHELSQKMAKDELMR
ncbi:cyclic nucleotide-binding domain-containing protein [candidate division KSB1 bacterium]|nr:cyclic nucleotide-binding domain-containing protein [candidate division KSB1 bacterium]